MPPIPIQPTGASGRVKEARRAAQQAAASYADTLANLTDHWGGLATAAKTEALRAGVVLCLRVLRYLITRDL